MEGRRYALVNAGEGVRAVALDGANDARTAASATFGGACVTSLAWRAKEEGERCDLLVGLANGEVCGVDVGRWLGEKAKRATATTTRWNADGDGVNASRTTCVRWRTRGDGKENLATGFDFVSLHADGSMYTYDSSKDVVAAKFEGVGGRVGAERRRVASSRVESERAMAFRTTYVECRGIFSRLSLFSRREWGGDVSRVGRRARQAEHRRRLQVLLRRFQRRDLEPMRSVRHSWW